MASLFPPKKGASVGITKSGKATKLMAITKKCGRPVSVLIAGASRHEVVLVQPTLDACIVSEMPAILIGDKAYDSDPLDASLRQRGIEMVASHKKIASVVRRKRVVVYIGASVVSKWSVFFLG